MPLAEGYGRCPSLERQNEIIGVVRLPWNPHMQFETWLVYVLAVIGLSLSPGPNGLLALSHGALYGRRMALYTIIGGCLGFVMVIAVSMFGIGALLKSSLFWLSVLKWVGGAYLVWLGIQIWRVVEFSIELLVASLASRISIWLTKVGRRFNQGCGAAFIAIGIALPLRT